MLTRQPDLLWQQLYNRLQWEGEEVKARLAPERQRRSDSPTVPWMQLATRFRESEALLRTLAGHLFELSACAVSPDGAWIVSAGISDWILKIWDVATGTERATLRGHTAAVNGCAISPDGAWIVSASVDKSLKIWDATSGTERVTLTGHTGWVNGCAISPDGTWIVSASSDKTLKIWDATSGTERATLIGHTAKCQVVQSARTVPGSSPLAWTIPQDLGRRHRYRTVYPHRPHRLGEGLCNQPGRHLDRLRQLG